MLEGGTEATAALWTIDLVARPRGAGAAEQRTAPRRSAGRLGPAARGHLHGHLRPADRPVRRQIESIRAADPRQLGLPDQRRRLRPRRSSEMREVLGGDRALRAVGWAGAPAASTATSSARWRGPRRGRYVALADQDDRWHPDKLEALLAGSSPASRLVYSDMRIVDARRAGHLRHLLALPAQQPHRLRLAPDRQHGHRRRVAVRARAARRRAPVPARARRRLPRPLARARWRWRSAGSATSTGRSTTTSSTGTRPSATSRPTRRRATTAGRSSGVRSRGLAARLQSRHLGGSSPYFEVYCRLALMARS